ncbi:MAG: N-acetyltransferase [Planctomycetes bacterium]|nr:N-acetyltransferase [Planctomycetota bacterium]
MGAGVRVGPFAVIGEGVVVGNGSSIGAHVVLHDATEVGAGVRIDDMAVIGKRPMRSPRSATTSASEDLPPARIGDGSIVGSHSVVYRGARIGDRVLVADYASVREEVVVSDETIVGNGVVIENRCRIGSRVKLETKAYVCALSEVGDGCFVAPGAVFTNDNYLGRTKERFLHHRGPTLERGARVGANATLLPGIRVGKEGVVAAGSVATRDVPAAQIVLGAPARPFRDVPESHFLDNQA